MNRQIIGVSVLIGILLSLPLSAQQTTMTSSSRVDWIRKSFVSDISFDTEKAGIELPSGRNTAVRRMEMKLPMLIKDPLLSLNVDSSSQLGDFVLDETLTLEQITRIILGGKTSAEVFKDDGSVLSTTNTIALTNVSSILVKQKYPYTPAEPVDSIESRPYSGIIIDARGELPVQGEYIKSRVSPCFFPCIWNENMDLVYERDMMEAAEAEKNGIIMYGCSGEESAYAGRVGTDPLYIRAVKTYGRYRTDPVISNDDAPRILTVKENRDLLRQGKVAVILDKDLLIHDVAAPQKDSAYYVTYRQVKQYFYENKVPGLTITDGHTGILFSVDLKFKPDSAQLLPEEKSRIAKIADMLGQILKDNEFTVLVEGHTADVGKPAGQMNLSIDRTVTVMNELIAEGLPKDLFSYRGYGGTKPVATNNTEAGRQQNRRVDITARPKATYIQRDW